MRIKSGRGTGGIVVSRKNRANIKKWFSENKDGTIAQCARELNLTWPTVKNHVVAIQKGE